MNIPDAFSKQPGFILLPVMLTIAMLGAIAYLMNYEGAMNANSLGREIEASQAQYAAKSGMNAMQWKANQANCTGYSNINATAFGTNSYSTTITPTSGSPVSIQSAGITATGASYTIARDRVQVYQTPTSKVIQPIAAASKDTLIYQLNSSYNYGGNNTISVSGVTFLKAKALMQFDLGSINTKAKITSATLQLYQNSGSNIAGLISVRPITSIWTAGTQAGASNTTGATWTKRDTTNNWSTAGGDYGATAFATHNIPNGVGWASWDITSLVTGWLSGSITNNGLMLQPEESWVTAYFASAENGDPLLAPKLTINYTCECGQTCDTTPPVTLPLAHWMLDETSGLTAVDSVGGHNGTLINGPIWSAGQLNGALNFDGINDYIDVPHHKDLSLTTSFTLSAWIKSYALQANTAHTLIAKEISINNANYWFGTWGDELNLGYSIGGVWNETITSGINLQTNTWYHVAVSFNATGNQVTYYLNGVDILKVTMPSPPTATNTSSLKIGRSPSGEYWKGILDDVRIYDGLLSEKEISELFAASSGGGGKTPLPPDITNGAITLAAVADTYIFENATTANYGSKPEFLVGTDSSRKQMLGLIRFDTASIPAGAKVTSATLRLYTSASAGSVSTGIYKIRNGWNENTATWNNMSSGGNYDSLQLALTTPAVGWTEWVLPTGLIHEWIDVVSTNYGIALEYTGSSRSREVRFAGKEHTTSTWRPQLVIEYTAP